MTDHSSLASSSLPNALRALAWLLISAGAAGILVIGVSFVTGSAPLSIDPIYLGLPFAGAGLLRCSGGWRISVLCLCWLSFIVLPIQAVVFLWMPSEVNLVFGRFHAKLAESPVVGWSSFVVTAAFAIGAYRVLTRPEIARLFKGVEKDERFAGSSQLPE